MNSAAVRLGGLCGIVFIALTAAGLSTEVAIPAVIARFGDVIAVGVVRPFLALAVWLYHYSQIGSAVLMFATSYAIWRTEVLPEWNAAAGFLGFLALAHTWLGLPAAYGGRVDWHHGAGASRAASQGAHAAVFCPSGRIQARGGQAGHRGRCRCYKPRRNPDHASESRNGADRTKAAASPSDVLEKG